MNAKTLAVRASSPLCFYELIPRLRFIFDIKSLARGAITRSLQARPMIEELPSLVMARRSVSWTADPLLPGLGLWAITRNLCRVK